MEDFNLIAFEKATQSKKQELERREHDIATKVAQGITEYMMYKEMMPTALAIKGTVKFDNVHDEYVIKIQEDEFELVKTSNPSSSTVLDSEGLKAELIKIIGS